MSIQKMMQKPSQCKCFTLIEVLIAISLTGVLVILLLNYFKNSASAHARMVKDEQSLLEEERMHLRLTHLFNHLAPPPSEKESLIFYTFSSVESRFPALVFAYASGVDKEPAFCGTLQAMLYLSREGELSLVSFPEQGGGRKEFLLDAVSSLSFSFFDPEKMEWKNTWEKTSYLPIIVKMTLSQEKASHTFVYFLLQ